MSEFPGIGVESVDRLIRGGKSGTIPGNEKFDAEADSAEAKTLRKLEAAAKRNDREIAKRVG